MKKDYGSVIKDITTRYLNQDNLPHPPLNDAEIQQMVEELFSQTVQELEAANALQASGSKYKIPDDPSPYQIAKLVLYGFHIRCINFGCEDKDSDVLAVYIDEGPDEGIYSTDEIDIKKRIRRFSPLLSRNGVKEVMDILQTEAEHVSRCGDKNIIPVNNGLFNYQTKTLMPFTPELIFTAKSRVNYVDNPVNPVIAAPDGTDWDVETWMSELSDDPEIVHLLWQVLGAIIRPGESWDKAVLFYSEEGNNGKGTLCELMRNLCGKGTYTSLKIGDMQKEFGMEELITASAIITDENDVGEYIDKSSVFKALVTHDVVQINRKYKEHILLRYTGLMVQCVNGIPRFKDKSTSLYRRLLVVPFNKCFTGTEKKYIKSDYMKRPEVLEYVLHKVLHMDFDELSKPAACKELLAEYREYNDPVRQFAAEILPRCTWDLLPFKFLYALYKSWSKENSPSGQLLGRNHFIAEMLKVLSDYPDWECQSKEYTSNGRMDKPELLIAEYGLDKWYNSSYQGTDPNKRCTIQAKLKYRGILRVSAKAAAASDDNK